MKQTTGVFAVLTATLFLGSMVGVGCGDDDTTTTGGAGTGGSGGSAGAATGGTAGKAGSGGSGGTAGGTAGAAGKAGSAGSAGAATDGGGDAPTTVTCGTRTCSPISGALTLAACCAPNETNTCGGVLPFGTMPCVTTTPGAVDASCPALMAMGQNLAGCCRPNGMCGVNVSILGLGCADPAVLGGPAAGACGGDAAPPPADVRNDTPAGDAPAGDAPAGDAPAGDAPTGDAPTGDAPTGDAPTGDAPTGDAPTGDATADVTPG